MIIWGYPEPFTTFAKVQISAKWRRLFFRLKSAAIGNLWQLRKQIVDARLFDLPVSLCQVNGIMKPILSKKICMLGPYSVGKTSLVKHFVHGTFSEKYLVTIGVKIDKKEITVGDQALKLMLWDIAGEEDEFSIPLSYLKGSEGCLLVMDGTRSESIDQALDILNRSKDVMGDIPVVPVINKYDLTEQWAIVQKDMDKIKTGTPVIKSSAKLGDGVEEAFHSLARLILKSG